MNCFFISEETFTFKVEGTDIFVGFILGRGMKLLFLIVVSIRTFKNEILLFLFSS